MLTVLILRPALNSLFLFDISSCGVRVFRQSGVNGIGGLFFLGPMAVAGRAGSLFQHRRKQKLRVGHLPFPLVLDSGIAMLMENVIRKNPH